MSADVWIDGHGGREAEVNITYNLSRMLRAGGFVGWSLLVTMSANGGGRHLLDVLDRMAETPDYFRAMNPPNGWGDYDECLQGRLRAFAVECVAADAEAELGGGL